MSDHDSDVYLPWQFPFEKPSKKVKNENEPPTFLTWRSAPEKTFSDWKIEIVSRSGDGETTVKGTYHVHRSVLVLESKYFQNLLFQNDRNGSFTESMTATSRIKLGKEGAASFEHFLDYMYRPDEPKLTTCNATAMHHFGEYFGMNHLRGLAGKFWKEDLSDDNVATYYKHAGIFHDDEVMQAVKNLSLKLLHKSRGQWALLLTVPDPQVWLYLLEKDEGSHSKKMSSFIGYFCTRHDVDPLTFAGLTDIKVLPVIDIRAARQLVEKEKDIIGDGSLTCLQRRCIAALSQDWRKVDIAGESRSGDGSFCDFLSKQSPEFAVELYKRTQLAARA